ncbi:CoA ester lyase [Gaiella sp.]|uniref:HpcH/HpaI aldolase/citrate lyase family protein n=1 Tax=Gaiella sp. TaxID=2663207 RepID=UPI00326761F2
MDPVLAKLTSARSFLVFPGDDDHKRERALASGADAVVLDLEDGVAPDAKAHARARLQAFATAPGSPVRLVRVNDPSGAIGAADLVAVARLDDVTVVVPKAGLGTVEVAAGTGRPLVALIEDAAGVRDAYELAVHPAVVALAIGSADLTASLGLVPTGDGTELLFVRSQLVVASVAAGIRPAIDGPCLDVHDPMAVEREARLARGLGLRGKLCIHPGQVAGVHLALAPTYEEVECAHRVVAAWDDILAGGAAVGVVDGMLVDLPVVQRARAVIESSERSEPV